MTQNDIAARTGPNWPAYVDVIPSQINVISLHSGTITPDQGANAP